MIEQATSGYAWVASIPDEAVVCLDTETTGVSVRADEVLQVALIGGDGSVLLNELVKPERHASWHQAERVHGITPQDVEDARLLRELIPEIDRILLSAGLVVGYNLRFDMGFLGRAGVRRPRCPLFDVMRAFAPIAKVRGEDGSFMWRSLEECARYFGVAFDPHDALEDARATLACFKRMVGIEERKRHGG